jgi:hypothetical protein
MPGLRSLGLFLQEGAFRTDVIQFCFQPLNFPVAILENEEIFNDAEHWATDRKGIPPSSQLSLLELFEASHAGFREILI